jgi:hypothetical protein
MDSLHGKQCRYHSHCHCHNHCLYLTILTIILVAVMPLLRFQIVAEEAIITAIVTNITVVMTLMLMLKLMLKLMLTIIREETTSSKTIPPLPCFVSIKVRGGAHKMVTEIEIVIEIMVEIMVVEARSIEAALIVLVVVVVMVVLVLVVVVMVERSLAALVRIMSTVHLGNGPQQLWSDNVVVEEVRMVMMTLIRMRAQRRTPIIRVSLSIITGHLLLLPLPPPVLELPYATVAVPVAVPVVVVPPLSASAALPE